MLDVVKLFLRIRRGLLCRAEIAELFGLSSVAYVTNHYIMPAVEKGLLSMSLPDKPRSKNQRYTTVR